MTKAMNLLKWTAIAALIAVLLCLLVINGFVNLDHSPSQQSLTVKRQSNVPENILKGGPLVVGNKSVQVPNKTVVLTFDDGPDPTWTPKVLALLEQQHVPATFFMVGANIARNEDIAKQVQRNGNEIGLRSFSRTAIARDTTRANLEMSEAQLALAGSTGISTSLFRPPHSSTAAAIDDNSWALVKDRGEHGYVTVLSTVDSGDSSTLPVETVVKNATPLGTAGFVLTLHDNRSQTVSALQNLIPKLKQKGYHFATTSQILQQSQTRAAPRSDVLRGHALIAAVMVATWITRLLTALLLVCGLLVTFRMIIMLAVAIRHARARRSHNWLWDVPIAQSASVIVPAYNEGPCIKDTVRSLLASDHPIEIIVVDDGSTDDTAAIAESIGAPNVRVIRKSNGGKASALNAGIAAARNELIVMMDGDTVFEPETVGLLVQPFADSTVGAVAGNAKVANRRSILGGWQHIEYVVGFNIDRRVYDVWQCMPTIAGAVGAYRRSVLLEVGGLSNATLAEDTDLTMSISRAGWRVVYEERALAHTEAPSTLRQLWQQRYRWSYGTMQSMWKHRHAVIERGTSGRFGRRGLANLILFQVFLPLTSPLVDVFLVYGMVFIDPLRTALAWLAMLAVQMLNAAIAFRLDREKLRALWLLPLQQFLWRQLMYLVLLQSAMSALGGIRLGWQKFSRTGGLGEILEMRRATEIETAVS